MASVSGTVVFHTGMSGYPELLTDPVMAGKILVLTYPLAGNYGVPDRRTDSRGIARFLESERIQVKGLIVYDYCRSHNHWAADSGLEEWMAEERIPGLTRVDTGALAKVLQKKGPLKGKIVPAGMWVEAKEKRWKEEVFEPIIIYEGRSDGRRILLVDCGVRHSLLRKLLEDGHTVVRVPRDYDFRTMEYDQVVISDGPGDPRTFTATLRHLKDVLQGSKPVTGTGLGHLLLGLAAGGRVVKMENDHRAHNVPVIDHRTGACSITKQNHGYVLEKETLPEDWEVVCTHLEDGTIEGIAHVSGLYAGYQFDMNP